MSVQPGAGSALYIVCAGLGALVFFLGPALALLGDTDPLCAASVGYGGITLFTAGIAARYSFAVAATPLLQLMKNLGVALAITGIFYAIFLLLYFI